MNYSRLVLTLIITVACGFVTGCGGSGTPLSTAQSSGKIVFSLATTALTIPRIAALQLNNVLLPKGITLAGELQPNGSIDINSNNTVIPMQEIAIGSAAFFPNEATATSVGRISISALDGSSAGINFGPIAELRFLISDNSLTATTLTTNYNTLNPDLTINAIGPTGSGVQPPIPYKFTISAPK